MTDLDRDTLDRFRRRMTVIENDVPAPPPFVAPRRPSTASAARPVLSVVVAVAIIAAAVAISPLLGDIAIGPPASRALSSAMAAMPSGSPAPPTSSAEPAPAQIVCGRISRQGCQAVIDLAAAAYPGQVAAAWAIVMDDTCQPSAVCDRMFAFDAAVVVLSPPGAQGPLTSLEVVGRAGPERVLAAAGGIPAHVQTLIHSLPGLTSVEIDRLGDWSALCGAVDRNDCVGSSQRFINLLAWSGQSVFAASAGLLLVSPRPDCPPVPDWADDSFCWQVSASAAPKPICMVIAKRRADRRYADYGQVGGDVTTGRPLSPSLPPCT